MSFQREKTGPFEFALIDSNKLLDILHFDIRDAVSTPFSARFTLTSSQPDIALTDLLDKAALFTHNSTAGQRRLHGHLFQCSTQPPGRNHTVYEILLVPKLHYLSERITCRIYQDKNVQSIIQDVLQKAGFLNEDYRFELSNTPTARSHCVQYNESDLNFIHRLLAEEGWFYWHEHQPDRHVLVITDNAVTLQEIAGDSTLPCHTDNGLLAQQETVSDVRHLVSLRPSAIVLSDYNADKPDLKLLSENAQQDNALIVEIYPANIYDDDKLKKISIARSEQTTTGASSLEVNTSSHRLQPGKRLTLRAHPVDAINTRWYVLSNHETGAQPQALEAWAGSGVMHYTNHVTLHPTEAPFRPAPRFDRPFIDSVQSAIVIGSSGEEIHTDNNGRIKVRFHWDTDLSTSGSPGSEFNTCWLRVMQTVAGSGWGSMRIPRVGQEVLVAFEHGNPDRPLVTGVLYNATNVPPLSLPADKACTVFATRTSPQGNAGHRVLLDDNKNREKIRVYSRNNLAVNIQGSQFIQIQGEDHIRVTGDFLQKILGNSHQDIQGSAFHRTQGDWGLQVDKDIKSAAQGEHYIQAGRTPALKAGSRLVIDASASLSLKGGAGTISINASGAALTGPMLNLNEGGASAASAGAPSLADTRQPDLPGNADAGGIAKASAHLSSPMSAHGFTRGGAQEYQFKLTGKSGTMSTISNKAFSNQNRDPIVAIIEDNAIKQGNFNNEAVRTLQQTLHDKGYDITVDGDWGPKTEAAYREYLSSSFIKIKSEYIAVAGSQHDNSCGNKMMFVAQAVRQLSENKFAYPDSLLTLIIFSSGYTPQMLEAAKFSAISCGANFLEVFDIAELFSYLNEGKDRQLFPIELLAIYSHGVPQRIAFGYHFPDDMKMSLDVLNFRILLPDAFNKGARIDSYACRTGMGNRPDWLIEEGIQFYPQTNESLAQLLANHLRVTVGAYVRRSNYEDTWGTFEQRRLGDTCSLSNNQIPSKEWCKKWNELANERQKKSDIISVAYQNIGAINPVKSGDTPALVPNGFYDFIPE